MSQYRISQAVNIGTVSSRYNRCSSKENPLRHKMGKSENVLITSADNGSYIHYLYPTVGQCTISQSISAIIGWCRFGTVLFSLQPVPVCSLGAIRAIISPRFFLNCIVSTLNYANNIYKNQLIIKYVFQIIVGVKKNNALNL